MDLVIARRCPGAVWQVAGRVISPGRLHLHDSVGQPRWHLAGYCDEFSVGHSVRFIRFWQKRQNTRGCCAASTIFLLNMKWAMAAQELKNPLNRYGAKFFSQSDEDGITLEIIKRLD